MTPACITVLFGVTVVPLPLDACLLICRLEPNKFVEITGSELVINDQWYMIARSELTQCHNGGAAPWPSPKEDHKGESP
jgi:hypothetical protein